MRIGRRIEPQRVDRRASVATEAGGNDICRKAFSADWVNLESAAGMAPRSAAVVPEAEIAMRYARSLGFLLVASSGLAPVSALRLAHAQAVSGSTLSVTAPGTANFSNDATGMRVSVFPVTPTTGDPYTSPDSVQVGGFSDFNGGGSLTVRGAPYGFLDTGTLLSIVSTSHSLYNSRAGVNSGYNGYPAGLSAMAAYPDFNSVNLYNQTTALPPRIIVSSGVTFTPMQIQFATPLTAQQISQLRRNMWVTTNAIDPTIAQVVTGSLASVANSGDSVLTLGGTVNVSVGSYVKSFHAGINGPTVTVTSVTSSGGNTVVGLSSPLVDGGTDQSPITSYPAGTSYGFVTYNTAAVTASATSVGSSSLTFSGVFKVPVGTALSTANPGIAAGTTVVSTSTANNTTVVTLSNPIVTDAAGDASYASGTAYYLTLPYVWPAGQHIPTFTYGSTITGWDPAGGSISVNGWTVPGGGRAMTGQVPSSLFDPTMPYTTPTVYIGTPTTATINNWVQSYDPSPTVPATSTPSEGEASRIQAFEGLELDQWNFAKRDYEGTFRGLTIGYTPLASVTSGGVSHSVLPSSDSYDLQLAGNVPTLLRFTGAPTANYIIGDSMLFKGTAGVNGAAGNTAEMFEHSAFMDGIDNFRLTDWLQKDSSVAGSGGGSMRLGLILNGTQGNVITPQSQVVFDVPGVGPGSIGMFGYSGSGLYVDQVGVTYVSPNGALSFKTGANANGGLISSDITGDLVLGTRTSGAQILATAPLLAQDGISVAGGTSANVITAPSMLVKGNAGVAGAAGNTGELFEQSGYMDGTNNMRLVDWLQKDTSAIGAAGGSMHLGLIIDGAQGVVRQPQSQIVFDPAGFGTGSVGMLGYNGGGVVVNTSGNTTLTNGSTLIFQNGTGATGSGIYADSAGNLNLSSAISGGAGLSIPASSTNGVKSPTMTVFSNNRTVNASSASLGWNCSNGGGEACLQVAGDAGAYNGFSVYQDSSSNQLGQATKIFGIDRLGTETILNAFYAGGSIYTGPNASLVLRTASSANGGTVSTDSAGDVVLYSSQPGGRVVAGKPLVLASATYSNLPPTGTAGTEMLCTDCLKPGEAGGAGTGMLVVDDGHAHWITTAGVVATH